MSSNTASVVNDSDRRIDDARYERALTEAMDVEMIAPGMAIVEHDGETHTVDFDAVRCDCPDHQYRNVICKHLIKSALVCLYDDDQPNTEFVARVARHAAAHGCVADESGCAGPTTIGTRGFPCPACVVEDEWIVWTHLVGTAEAGQ